MMLPALAVLITGALLPVFAVLSFDVSRSMRLQSGYELAAGSPAGDDLVSRSTYTAKKMAMDSPVLAALFPRLAGIASVSLPEALNPSLQKSFDDIEVPPVGPTGS